MTNLPDSAWLARLGRLLRVAALACILAPVVWAMWASWVPIERLHSGAMPWAVGGGRGGWANYDEALTQFPFLSFAVNSIVLSVAQVCGTLLSCSLTGFALAQYDRRGNRFWFSVLLATMMIPGQVLLIAQFVVYQQLGWVGSYRPLIVPAWLAASSFFVYVFREYFRNVPRAYEESARIDGASPWQVYWYVMLPMARPVLAAVACLALLGAWHEFLEPLVYLSDYRRYPLSVGLRMMQSIEGSRGNVLMAACILSMLPPLAALFWARRALFGRAEEPPFA
ncbi:L-arabinose transport system permease protein AraQ [Phycisphaerae bacterium RAS2]|nr:L-arabinose transport system permease protein AraQ [Phycisphaerae bacterium RAS2]